MSDTTETPPRRDDHVQIERLAEELLPELAVRLAAGNLGEIEVREDGWKIRLRRPAPHGAAGPRRAADRAAAERSTRTTHPAHAATAGVAPPGGSSSAGRVATPDALGTLGLGAPAGHEVHDGSADAAEHDGDRTAAHGRFDAHRIVARSPAVGIFQARAEIRPGGRVRSGDRLAVVDLLGVPQDVVAPEDGIVVTTLVESGDGVEYGQELIVIERVTGLPSGATAIPSEPAS